MHWIAWIKGMARRGLTPICEKPPPSEVTAAPTPEATLAPTTPEPTPAATTVPPTPERIEAPETTVAPTGAPTTTPAAVTTAAPAPATTAAIPIAPYYTMKSGSCCCPEGEQIATQEDCEKAHDALGLPRTKVWRGRARRIPGGCITRENAGRRHNMHWNAWIKGMARRGLTPICKKA